MKSEHNRRIEELDVFWKKKKMLIYRRKSINASTIFTATGAPNPWKFETEINFGPVVINIPKLCGTTFEGNI